MGCMLLSYSGAPSDETIPYHAAVLEPLQPYSLICYGPELVKKHDIVSDTVLSDGQQIYCSWRDSGPALGSVTVTCCVPVSPCTRPAGAWIGRNVASHARLS